MRFEFLMVCHTETANVDFIRELLGQALRERGYDEASDEELAEAVSLTLTRSIPESKDENGEAINRTLCGFELDLSDETPNLPLFIEDFTKSLANASSVEHVLKFYDDDLLHRNLVYMREVFELEMKLRKALSVIYLATYSDGHYNLLRDETVSIASKEKPTEGDMRPHYENEFFHLLFSQYVGLNQRKQAKSTDDLLHLVRKVNSFDALRDEVEREPVPDENDKVFLASLKQRVDAVEKLRNCVAHNRTPPRRVTENYQTTRGNLAEALEEFLGRFAPE